MQPLGSIAAVCAAIREDAASEAERIAREGAEACARVQLEEARAPDNRESRLAVARRAAREQLATEDSLDTRAALEAREAWIARVVARAKQLGETPDARRARFALLVKQAAAQLPPGRLVVSVSPQDLPLLDGAVADETLSPGSLRVASGKLSLDESLEARARRSEPAWRAALGRIWG